MKRSETSAGGVVFRQGTQGIEVALGEQRDRVTGARTLRLPKGKPEGAESLPATALREVAEEAGLVGRIVGELGRADYVYREPAGEVAKRVHFFLMEFAGELGSTDGELDRVRWLALAAAERELSFEPEREIVRRARALLEP